MRCSHGLACNGGVLIQCVGGIGSAHRADATIFAISDVVIGVGVPECGGDFGAGVVAKVVVTTSSRGSIRLEFDS